MMCVYAFQLTQQKQISVTAVNDDEVLMSNQDLDQFEGPDYDDF